MGPLRSRGAPGEVTLILKGELEFSRKKRRVAYSRDLEDEQMIVFSGKRAACREGLAPGGEGLHQPFR